MGIGSVTDAVLRAIDDAQEGIGELFEPVINLGVTGLSRSGKTVFITSLVANLLDRGRMPQLIAASEGRIVSAFLQPQPDDTIPRFDYETHLAALTGPEPHWPHSTRSISQLRLSLKIQPTGILSGMSGPRTVHIDIVDYPGEWLLDLPLLNQSFADWSESAFAQAKSDARADFSQEWRSALEACDPSAQLDEPTAQTLAKSFTSYLSDCREAGFSGCAPGRFLLPGDLAGSPALTFAPLLRPERVRSKMLYAEFERRFEAYKRKVVKPFFRNHFSKLDRQIVLVDVLGAVHSGPQAVEDMRQSMRDILTCFRPGRNSWLSGILGKKVDHLLFAATKADHLHHTQHAALTSLLHAMLREAKDRADFKGAKTGAMAVASLRATIEKTVNHGGETLECVQGVLLDTGKTAAMHAGDLPTDPAHLLVPAKKGADRWLDRDYSVMRFAPPVLHRGAGEGLPHIRLDKASEFLIGDKL